MDLTTIYKQLLGLPSVSITHVEVAPKLIRIEWFTKSRSHTCPTCQQPTTSLNQYYTRTLRDLNMGIRLVHLVVKMRQLHCQKCHRYFSESLDFADLGKDYTYRQADYMFILARKQSYSEVAAVVDTSPITVERVVLARCTQVIDLPTRYTRVRRLGIDELGYTGWVKKTFSAS